MRILHDQIHGFQQRKRFAGYDPPLFMILSQKPVRSDKKRRRHIFSYVTVADIAEISKVIFLYNKSIAKCVAIDSRIGYHERERSISGGGS